MLKRTIKYEDFNGEMTSDVVYFNLTESELVELELSYDRGFGETLQAIIDAKDHKTLITEFKKIVLLAYGVKSEDGKRFIKSDELRLEFSQTAAYNAIFMELATNENAAADFINQIMPKKLMAQVEQDKPTSTPSLPPPPSI